MDCFPLAEEYMTPTITRNMIFTATCALLSGCGEGDSVVSDQHQVSFDTVVAVKHSESVIGLAVRNHATDTAWILMGPASAPLATDAVQLAQSVTNGISEDADRVKALFFHVAERFDYARPLSQERDPHEPMRGFRVYGWGYCDDFAAIFANLCSASGYPSRVWGLSGHVVAEVFYDGGWHLFDPTAVRYLENESGIVLSYEAISSTDLIQELYPSLIQLPFRHALRTRKDNVVNDWWLTDDRYDAVMVVPPGCELSFHRVKTLALHEILRDTLRGMHIQRGTGLMTVAVRPDETKIHSHISPFRVTEVEVVCPWSDGEHIKSISLNHADKSISMERHQTVDSIRWHLTFNPEDEVPVYAYELVSESFSGFIPSEVLIRTRFMFAPKALWPDETGLKVQFIDGITAKPKALTLSIHSSGSEE